VLELCYYTGQRVGDVLRIRRADLIGEGIAFTQQKTGSKLIVRWTPELRAAVERAKQLHGNIAALTLLHSRTGRAPRYNAVREQWAAACRVAGVEDARLHDIRAMAATVAKRQGLDAQALLGHADPSTTKGYLRGREPAVVEGPGIGHLIDAKR
jgi:integrase